MSGGRSFDTTYVRPFVQPAHGPPRVNLHRETSSGRRRASYKTSPGDRYGKLVATRRLTTDRLGVHWLCHCDCGGMAIRRSAQLNRSARNGTVARCAECARSRLAVDRGSMWADMFRRTGTVWPASAETSLQRRVSDALEADGHFAPTDRGTTADAAQDEATEWEPGTEIPVLLAMATLATGYGYQCDRCKTVSVSIYTCICLRCGAVVCETCQAEHRHPATEWTLESIAIADGTSRERIRQIQEGALRKLRGYQAARLLK